jgi:hypothetical protein
VSSERFSWLPVDLRAKAIRISAKCEEAVTKLRLTADPRLTVDPPIATPPDTSHALRWLRAITTLSEEAILELVEDHGGSIGRTIATVLSAYWTEDSYKEWGGPPPEEMRRRAACQPFAKHRKNGIKFQCPGCAAEGHDKHRDNAIVFNDGRWGCAYSSDHNHAIGELLEVGSSSLSSPIRSPIRSPLDRF